MNKITASEYREGIRLLAKNDGKPVVQMLDAIIEEWDIEVLED